MSKLPSGLGRLHGAGKWIMVAVTSLAAVIGLLVNARALGLAPWLGLGTTALADLAARRVLVAPAHDTMTAIGDSAQLAATVTDEHGAVLTGATVRWTTDDSTVATVDSSGSVAAVGAGTATITAAVRDHAGHARLTVAQRVAAVVIGTGSDTVLRVPEGSSTPLAARALDARGRRVAGRIARWTSADTTLVAITASGAASARAPGRTTLTAEIEGAAASVPVEVTLAPGSAQVISGDGQRATAGRRLPLPIKIQVLSRSGRPVPGITVTITTADAQGEVDPAAATTDRDGRALVAWSLGRQPGRQHLLLNVAGVDSAIAVTAEADPDPALTRVRLIGEPPQGQAGVPLAAPVGIRVTDTAGVAEGDVPVVWTAPDGGNLEALAPRTDTLGQAWARWTLARRAGPQRARVQVGNPRTMPPFTVTATAVAGAATAVRVESGADQDGAVGALLRRPIVARVTDSAGNPAAGAAVRVRTGDGSVPESLLAADPAGRVSLRWTLGRRAGPQWLELRAAAGSPTRVNARATPLEPANIGATGAPRSGPAARALPRPVVFVVTDAYQNPVADVQVEFAATGGSVAPARVMTDAKGEAATRWTLGSRPGEQSLTATVRRTAVKDSVVVRAVRRSAGR